MGCQTWSCSSLGAAGLDSKTLHLRASSLSPDGGDLASERLLGPAVGVSMEVVELAGALPCHGHTSCSISSSALMI